jgi:hypothetical protein
MMARDPDNIDPVKLGVLSQRYGVSLTVDHWREACEILAVEGKLERLPNGTFQPAMYAESEGR